MRPYFKDATGMVSYFPNAVWSGMEFRDARTDWPEITETGEAAGADNAYTVALNNSILAQTTLVVTDEDTSTELIIVPYGSTVGSLEAGVSSALGLVELHSSRAGHQISVTYTPYASNILALLMNKIALELCALQSVVAAGLPGRIYPRMHARIDGTPDASDSVAASKFYTAYPEGTRLSVARVIVFVENMTGAQEGLTTRLVVTYESAADAASIAAHPERFVVVDLSGSTDCAVVEVAQPSAAWPVDGVWINVFCVNASGQHAGINVEVEVVA